MYFKYQWTFQGFYKPCKHIFHKSGCLSNENNVCSISWSAWCLLVCVFPVDSLLHIVYNPRRRFRALFLFNNNKVDLLFLSLFRWSYTRLAHSPNTCRSRSSSSPSKISTSFWIVFLSLGSVSNGIFFIILWTSSKKPRQRASLWVRSGQTNLAAFAWFCWGWGLPPEMCLDQPSGSSLHRYRKPILSSHSIAFLNLRPTTSLI